MGLPRPPRHAQPAQPRCPRPTRPADLPALGKARGPPWARPPRPAAAGGEQRKNRATQGSGPVAALPNRPDPVGELRFKVELPGVDIGRFRECSGLSAEIEVKDYNEGGVNDRVHKLPTRMKFPPLVLKRGVTYEDALLKWLWKTQREVQRVNMTVSLLGPDGQPVRSWAFAEAYPIKWTGPKLNAGSSQVATESLEIVHAGLQLVG